MRKFLLYLCPLLLFLPTAWAQKNYETTYKLDCGPTQVTITNTCTWLDEEDIFCSKQKLKFFNTKTGKSTEQVYLPKPLENVPQIFAAELTCLNHKRSYYITVGNATFANCSTCEWDDVFDLNGRYIGTPRKGFANALSRPFKKLPHRLSYILDSYEIINDIHISRRPQHQEKP
jgi:hypothetical protein